MTEILEIQTNSALNEDEILCGFVKDCELRNLEKVTINGYKSRLQKMIEVLRQRGLSIIRLDKESLKVILEYLQSRRFAYQSLVHNFAALSGFSDYLVYEGIATANLVRPFRKRYVRKYKQQHDPERKLISVEEMAMLINSILDPRDRAIVTLLAKTGIRRGELIRIDVDDLNWMEQSIRLKLHPKRSNCIVFFDDETARVLQRWIRARASFDLEKDCESLFVNERGGRLMRHGVLHAVTKHAQRVGLHNPKSEKIEDHFTPHCCRHWFTTHLRRNGLRRELIQELRGDARKEAVDIYDHIDKKELKRAYLAAMPILGIE